MANEETAPKAEGIVDSVPGFLRVLFPSEIDAIVSVFDNFSSVNVWSALDAIASVGRKLSNFFTSGGFAPKSFSPASTITEEELVAHLKAACAEAEKVDAAPVPSEPGVAKGPILDAINGILINPTVAGILNTLIALALKKLSGAV